MSNWKKVKLGEVCDYTSSRISIDLLNAESYISTENMLPLRGGITSASSMPTVSAVSAFQVGNVLISNIRPYFKKIWFADFDGGCSNDVLCLCAKKDVVYDHYLYYLLAQDSFFDYVMSGAKGSKMPRGDKKQILDFEIELPSLEEQERIAGILSSLDDKIELNNRINKNLEQQAQALFKRWFVDFDFPDQNNNPYRTSGNPMTPSSLGNIPHGWRVGTIRDLTTSTLGGDWGKESAEGNFKAEVLCIRGADIPEVSKGNLGKMPTRYILEKNYIAKKLSANDLVVEISGGSPTQSTGRIALISQELLERFDKDLVCTNFCRAIKPIDHYAQFVYYMWRYLYDSDIMFSYENGTTGIKNLDINSLLDTEQIAIPRLEIAKNFATSINSLYRLIYKNAKQNYSLTQLRDTLLPKLMNNEIKL